MVRIYGVEDGEENLERFELGKLSVHMEIHGTYWEALFEGWQGAIQVPRKAVPLLPEAMRKMTWQQARDVKQLMIAAGDDPRNVATVEQWRNIHQKHREAREPFEQAGVSAVCEALSESGLMQEVWLQAKSRTIRWQFTMLLHLRPRVVVRPAAIVL